MKRAGFFLGFFLLCLPLLDAQSGKKPLTLQDVIHPASIIAPGITALSWRPGGKQLTYIRPSSRGMGAFPTLCAYDLASRTETVIFNPADGKRNSDLSPISGLRAATRSCSRGKAICGCSIPKLVACDG